MPKVMCCRVPGKTKDYEVAEGTSVSEVITRHADIDFTDIDEVIVGTTGANFKRYKTLEEASKIISEDGDKVFVVRKVC